MNLAAQTGCDQQRRKADFELRKASRCMQPLSIASEQRVLETMLTDSLKTNTHRRRRRDSTVELHRIGGVYWTLRVIDSDKLIVSVTGSRNGRQNVASVTFNNGPLTNTQKTSLILQQSHCPRFILSRLLRPVSHAVEKFRLRLFLPSAQESCISRLGTLNLEGRLGR